MIRGDLIKRVTKRKVKKISAISITAMLVIAAFLPFLTPEVNLNYTKLLSTIAKGESNGNYNAYYGHPDNKKTKFTSMTVGEVLEWQKKHVKNGSPSSAVGKYQFIRPTLAGLVREHKINKGAVFNKALQDRLAIALLERRGVNDYAKGKITREQFAHNLSKEWAALPKTIGKKPNQSYYAEDGLNKVQISQREIFSSIETLHK